MKTSMPSVLSYQPFKGLATIAFFAVAPPWLLTIGLWYLLPSNRPNPKWSLRTAIGSAYLRLFFRFGTWIEMTPVSTSKMLLGNRYVFAQPGPDELYTGITRLDKNITPVKCPAAWFPQRPDSKVMAPGAAVVVLQFQGGGYVTATDPGKAGPLPARVVSKMTDKKPISALWSQYRLSRSEDARFPAALQDAITLYHYVLDLGVPAENIIISGESAGGHLVIALLRYIADYKTLPWPRGAIAWSPWCDISHRALDGYRKSHRYKTDILNMGMLEWGIGAFPPRDRNEESERYLSPVDYPFPCKAPLYINVGTDEVLYPEIHNFAKRMQEVQGNRIRYEEMKDVPHDVLLNAYFTGLTAEAEHQAAQAGQFFEIEK